MQKGVLNQMSDFIKVVIELPLFFAVRFGRNFRLHARLLRHDQDRIGIISLVRNEMLSFHSLYQLASLCAISHGTCCNKDSHRHTMRIHGQMYLAVSPPFVRPIASLPPLAPAAC